MDDIRGKLGDDEVFRKRYRVSSARLTGWDYSSSFNGAYFVTICTKDRESFFGEISGGIMRNSFLGNVADACWREISEHFPWVITDEFVVMPNHVHGILFFKGGADDIVGHLCVAERQTKDKNNHVETQDFASRSLFAFPIEREETHAKGETQNLASLQAWEQKQGWEKGIMKEAQARGNVFGPQRKNLASVIRGFKVGVTKRARKEGLHFFWQPRFYDRVIRNERELNRIREYIFSNPKNWEYDSENTLRMGNKMTE